MIVKPTVNELLENIENRYALVIAASKRAREISKGDKPLIETDEKSSVTIAANEIADKKVYVDDGTSRSIEQENIEETEQEIIEEKEGE